MRINAHDHRITTIGAITDRHCHTVILARAGAPRARAACCTSRGGGEHFEAVVRDGSRARIATARTPARPVLSR
jgi:hypothetical protein